MMKHIWVSLSVSLLIALLFVTTLPISAQEQVNVARGAKIIDAFGVDSASSFATEKVFDGVANYARGYMDVKLIDSPTYINEKLSLYFDENGEVGEENSIYLYVFHAKLAKPAYVDSFRMWFCGGKDIKYDIDGFDLFVSESGEDGSWIKVYSGTKLRTQNKYEQDNTVGNNVSAVGGSFARQKVNYVAFCMSEPRSTVEGKAYSHYLRITELQLYGSVIPAETTAAPITTAAPDTTTAAPITTAAPDTTTAALVTTAVPDTTTAIPAYALPLMASVLVISIGAARLLRKKTK